MNPFSQKMLFWKAYNSFGKNQEFSHRLCKNLRTNLNKVCNERGEAVVIVIKIFAFSFKVNLPPNVTTPSLRYALIGEDLRLQLEGEDPEKRPFVVKMIGGSPSLASFSDNNVLHWTPESLNSTKFFFKATDECNASSTFNMTIEILTCPCTDKGTCVPDPNHPRGSGMYYCECQPGYEGQTCEKEIDECLQSPCLHGKLYIEI